MRLQPAQQAAASSGLEQKWWLPHVVLLCCQLAFAVMHISSHAALEHIPPLPYSAMRVTLALPLLFAGARIKASCLPAHQRWCNHLARLSLVCIAHPAPFGESRARTVCTGSREGHDLAGVLAEMLGCSLGVTAEGREFAGTLDGIYAGDPALM